MRGLNLVTIKIIRPLFKKVNGEKIETSLCLATFKENEYSVVIPNHFRKNDKVYFIPYGYVIPENHELFEDYKPLKKYLEQGKIIKPVKFNLEFKNSAYDIYSQGIILTVSNVEDFCKQSSKSNMTIEEMIDFIGIKRVKRIPLQRITHSYKNRFKKHNIVATAKFSIEGHSDLNDNIYNRTVTYEDIVKDIEFPVNFSGYDNSKGDFIQAIFSVEKGIPHLLEINTDKGNLNLSKPNPNFRFLTIKDYSSIKDKIKYLYTRYIKGIKLSTPLRIPNNLWQIGVILDTTKDALGICDELAIPDCYMSFYGYMNYSSDYITSIKDLSFSVCHIDTLTNDNESLCKSDLDMLYANVPTMKPLFVRNFTRKSYLKSLCDSIYNKEDNSISSIRVISDKAQTFIYDNMKMLSNKK